ncbi:MAG TPA: DUF1573 domain-containing protein [Lutibacter sp.]|nr:DUF1573 domain-containing protein [Lutibacter sp.]
MKNLFFITLVLMYSVVFSQDSADTTAKIIDSVGIFDFDTETINYGNIIKDSDGKRTFVFKNIGNAPIIITKIKTSCGCTLASKLTKPILPGESAEIDIEYTTKKLGAFSKTVTITSNAAEARKVVRIKGRVVAQ